MPGVPALRVSLSLALTKQGIMICISPIYIHSGAYLNSKKGKMESGSWEMGERDRESASARCWISFAIWWTVTVSVDRGTSLGLNANTGGRICLAAAEHIGAQ